ncbi:MAG: hypothetical protein ABI378_12680 [Chitinophagaceae bacterium]
MLRFLLLGLLLYFLIRFIVRFVLPVAKMTSTIRGNMKNAEQNQAGSPSQPKKPKPKNGDYIDYEMIK